MEDISGTIIFRSSYHKIVEKFFDLEDNKAIKLTEVEVVTIDTFHDKRLLRVASDLLLQEKMIQLIEVRTL